MVASARRTVVGHPPNFWLFSNRDGFDLTHPPTPSSPLVYPRLTMRTSNTPVTIAPSKTAMVIVDMQNFFLSSAMGRSRGEGHEAEEALLKYGIPAARKLGIQIVWLTWGITEEGLKTVPPVIWRVFGFETVDEGDFEVEDDGETAISSTEKKMLRRPEKKTGGGLGSPLGPVKLDNGTFVEAGRMLMRDQWNTALHEPLEEAFQDGKTAKRPDVRFQKERLSGLWGPSGPLDNFLERQGVTTLLFAGVNTDQCVLASLQDACTKSWDTILLKDGCGTTSPEYAKKMVEFNCQKSWGFVSSCEALSKGAENVFNSKEDDYGHRDEL